MSRLHKDVQAKEAAERIYREMLAEMHKEVGITTTFSTQLHRAGKKYFKGKFKGVFAANRMPQQIKPGDLFIANLDDADEPGSHWVGIGKDKHKEHGRHIIWVYDSFGRELHKILPNIFNNRKKAQEVVQSTERDAEQRVEEKDCGARTLAFLYILHKFGGKYAKWI